MHLGAELQLVRSAILAIAPVQYCRAEFRIRVSEDSRFCYPLDPERIPDRVAR